jgi:hypothetical protein
VAVENFSESLRHLGTHRDSLKPFQPARTTELADNDGASRIAMTVETISGRPDDPDEWRS